jgi:hypothetical protein
LKEVSIEKGISDIVGVFTDPIVVTPSGAAWADCIPKWLKDAIILERLIENIRALREGSMTGTDAEACAYLHTLSLDIPLDGDWTQIYLYIATKVYERHRSKDSNVTFPDDVRVDSISNYQMGKLNELKRWIYETRVKGRLEKDRAERREKREEEAERKKKEQFTFSFFDESLV